MREDSILLKHPALFAECFDFSVPGGWRDIVAALCDELAKEPDCRISQVKEKFGGLRVYREGGTAKQTALILAAEDKAARTCQRCGADGAKRRSTGWVRTLCDSCAEAQ